MREDVSFPEEMGNFRWLTVGKPEQADVSIVLMAVPGPSGNSVRLTQVNP